jgi:Cu/Ag efflux pump CusA
LASLLVAVVVTPAWCLLFHQHNGPPPEPPVLKRMKDLHDALLTRLCARPVAVLICAGVLGALALAALPLFRPEFLPSVHDSHLVVQTSEPPSTSIAATRDSGERIAAALRPLSAIRTVSERIGRDPTGDDSWGPERSLFDLALSPSLGAAQQRQAADLVSNRFQQFPGLGATVTSRFDAEQNGLQSTAPVEIRIFGQDLDALESTAEAIAAVLRGLPGARDVMPESHGRAPTVRVDIQFQRLALYGLSAADVLDTVQAAFAGERVAQIYQDGRVIDLAVSAQASLRRDPEAVGDLLLRSTSGVSTPLKSVANVYLTDDRTLITHDGGLRRQLVTAAPEDPTRFADLARRAIASRIVLPPGTFVAFGGSGQAIADARNGLLLNYALALFGVIVLLSVAFDGRTGALILITSLLAFIGAAAAVDLMGGVLSIGAVVAFIALFGLSMRSAILIFSKLEDMVLSKQAHWSLGAIIAAARGRLTPVFMTALLVALAVAPLAIHADRPGREILGPMAIVILGGLVTGTLGSVIVLPALIHAFWRPGYARRARRHGIGPQSGAH